LPKFTLLGTTVMRCRTPLPLKVICTGEFEALLVKERLPAALLVAVGANFKVS
jgi:hypothetical protein